MDQRFGLETVLCMLDENDLQSESNESEPFWPNVEVEVESRPVYEVIADSYKLMNNSLDKSDASFNDDDNDEYDEEADPSYVPDSDSTDEEKQVSFPAQAESISTRKGSDDEVNRTDDQLSSRSRKRKRDPSSWQRNVRHRKRLMGESYITRKGKRVPLKEPKHVDCKRCRFKCSRIFDEDERRRICAEYYALGDNSRQKDYICKRVKVSKVARHRSRQNKRTKKKSCEYTFVKDDKDYRVCKTFFQSTLDIGHSAISTAISSKDLSGNYSSDDGKKKKVPGNKISVERINFVKDHINSFEPVESHYCRAQTKARYLQSDLSISKMYHLYLNDFCTRMSITDPVSSSKYRDIFLNDFNLRFFKPKKDQCTVCNAYYTAVGEDKDRMKVSWEDHKRRETESLEEKQRDKERAKHDQSFRSISFDLQAVLNLPHAGDAQIFYKRKLSVYNFTIYESHSANGICFLWNECEGQRGSSEIGTSLLKYLENLPETVHHVASFSDTCSGQNRNQYVASAMLYAVQTIKNLTTVDLKFMESGHSYMEVDSMHSVIERASKHVSLYTDDEWVGSFRCARRNPQPYIVHHLQHQNFYDMKDLANHIMKNRTKNTEGDKVNWLNIKWMRFEKAHPGIILYKYNISDVEFLTINTRKTNANIILTNAYTSQLPISAAKKKDLINLLSTRVIPPNYHQYYANLPSSTRMRPSSSTRRSENADYSGEDSDDYL